LLGFSTRPIDVSSRGNTRLKAIPPFLSSKYAEWLDQERTHAGSRIVVVCRERWESAPWLVSFRHYDLG
jgi:hypothetical protein